MPVDMKKTDYRPMPMHLVHFHLSTLAEELARQRAPKEQIQAVKTAAEYFNALSQNELG